jgi:small glutamine-rich tetratricopeptide repeat-containing protein alpha
VTINPSYAKAFSRLGTARFYEGNYRQAVDAFTRALDLDSSNENYKRDLEQAKDKLGQAPVTAAAGNPFAAMAGMPGMGGMGGGMPNVDSMMQMMSNPAFQQMASSMMQNPDFMNMVSGMATRMGSQAPSVDEMNTFLQSGASDVDAEGNMRTPFGTMPRADFDRLREQQLENPKMRAIMEDVRANGMSAMTKYMGDPDVMASIQSLMGQMRPSNPNGGNAGNGGAIA